MIVEWNTHLFSADQSRYPFHAQSAYRPGDASLLADPLASYLESMAARSVERAVLVQPEPYGDDHALVLDSVARDPERLKCTSLFYPQDPQAVAKLDALAEREPRLVATRFHAHRGKEMYLPSFDAPYVRDLWRRAGELGLVIELHIGPDYARQVAQVVASMPGYPVLIDHMCEPCFGQGDEYEDVLALAQYGNVTIKLSGLAHFSQEPEPYLDTGDLVRRVADAFGPTRLGWSGGSPAIVDALLEDWSQADRELIKGGTLAKLAGFA